MCVSSGTQVVSRLDARAGTDDETMRALVQEIHTLCATLTDQDRFDVLEEAWLETAGAILGQAYLETARRAVRAAARARPGGCLLPEQLAPLDTMARLVREQRPLVDGRYPRMSE